MVLACMHQVKLERKGNRQTRWLLAPLSEASAATGVDGGEDGGGVGVGDGASGTGGSGGGGVDSRRGSGARTLRLLEEAPTPLPAVAAEVGGMHLCHFCDVEDVSALAQQMLEELMVATAAARGVLTKQPQPGLVRAELEQYLLMQRPRAAAAATPSAPAAWAATGSSSGALEQRQQQQQQPSVVAGVVAALCDEFAKSKTSFGGRFSNKEGRRDRAAEMSPEMRQGCALAWPWRDRLQMASWLHWVHDPPLVDPSLPGAAETRSRSCWLRCADAEGLAEHRR
jgi:hypothetical protein